MKKRSVAPKAVMAAALALIFAFTWSAAVAQETPVVQMVAPAAEPPSPPQLMEAEQKARSARIILLQSKVDDCNVTFMGLPTEHGKCIQEIISLMESDAPAGDTVKVDAALD